MFGYYCKKLASSFFFLIIYFLFIMAVAFIWVHIASTFKNNLGIVFSKTFNYCMSAILTLLIELLAVYCIRIDNLKVKEAYVAAHTADTYTFKADFTETLKSKEHILHTAAFNTLMLPLFLLIGIGTKATAGLLIISAIFLTLVSITLFAAISTLLWCIVHKNWLSTKEPRDFKKLWKAILNRLKGWS